MNRVLACRVQWRWLGIWVRFTVAASVCRLVGEVRVEDHQLAETSRGKRRLGNGFSRERAEPRSAASACGVQETADAFGHFGRAGFAPEELDKPFPG